MAETDTITSAKSILRQAGQARVFVEAGGDPAEVTMASDLDGAPLISVDPIDMETLVDGCALEIPGGTTLNVYGLGMPVADGSPAHARYAARHGAPAFPLWRVALDHAVLVEGEDRHDIDVAHLTTMGGDALAAQERRAVDHMNDDHLDAVTHYATGHLGQEAGEWRLSSLDMEGLDLVAGDRFARLWFDPPLTEPDQIKAKLVDLARS